MWHSNFVTKVLLVSTYVLNISLSLVLRKLPVLLAIGLNNYIYRFIVPHFNYMAIIATIKSNYNFYLKLMSFAACFMFFSSPIFVVFLQVKLVDPAALQYSMSPPPMPTCLPSEIMFSVPILLKHVFSCRHHICILLYISDFYPRFAITN